MLKIGTDCEAAASTALRLARHFLSTEPDDFRPDGYDGEIVYGGGESIVYCVASLWYNALECARIMGDMALENELAAAFSPFLGEKRSELSYVPHVDFAAAGTVPLEIAILRGDERALSIGLNFAEAQWAKPRPNDIPPRNPIPHERRMGWWRMGYSPDTRLWIDDAYMITALQAQAYRATGDAKYIGRAADELLLYIGRLGRPDGLFNHQAEHGRMAWLRGCGWMAAALAIILRHLPADDARRPALLAAFLKMVDAILARQHPDGLWGQVADAPESWTESSGSAMFAYALHEGVRLGLIDAGRAMPAFQRAWAALLGRLDESGGLHGTCIGTGPSDDKAHYLARHRATGDPHGQAAMMWVCRSMLE